MLEIAHRKLGKAAGISYIIVEDKTVSEVVGVEIIKEIFTRVLDCVRRLEVWFTAAVTQRQRICAEFWAFSAFSIELLEHEMKV